MTPGVFDGDAAEALLENFGQIVWDEMPAAIGTHHGLLDDMTAARSVFHQIPSWNPNNFSPWSLAWFSIVGLQKFQHGDHSNHWTVVNFRGCFVQDV